MHDHGFQFCVAAIKICTVNKIEMLSYPSHSTQTLQGPDVVLNKIISSVIEKMIHSKPKISGNSGISRIAFMTILDHAVKTICTMENVLETFTAIGVIPYNPNKIDLSVPFQSNRNWSIWVPNRGNLLFM